MARPSAVDLFAGAGGLSIGLESAGLRIEEAVEFDADAASTYRSVHPGTKVHESDIAVVDFARLRGNVAAVVGGPPCQPFSVGGLRQLNDDTRDGFPQFARALHEVEPPVFLCENVAGVAAGAARPYFDRLIGVLEGGLPLAELLGERVDPLARLDYHVEWKILSAPDYGVPQARRRLVIVGRRRGLDFVWPMSRYGLGKVRPHRPSGEVIGPDRFGEPNPSKVTYARYPTTRPDPYHGQIYNGGGRPIDLSRPAPTLLASMGGNKTPWVDTLGVVPAYHAHLREGGRPRSGAVPGARRITPEEAAALQTFPTTMQWSGTRSSKYRQIGNAVPPRLAEALGRRLLATVG